MKFKIKHKKNFFQEQWYINIILVLIILFFLLINKTKLKIKTIVDNNVIYDAIDPDDWRKLIGTKSGVKTLTNDEEILVYRIYKNKIQVGKYIRRADENFNDLIGDFEIVNDKVRVYDVITKDLPKENEKLEFIHNIKLKYLLPVTPYAGGDKINIADYYLWIKFI